MKLVLKSALTKQIHQKFRSTILKIEDRFLKKFFQSLRIKIKAPFNQQKNSKIVEEEALIQAQDSKRGHSDEPN